MLSVVYIQNKQIFFEQCHFNSMPIIQTKVHFVPFIARIHHHHSPSNVQNLKSGVQVSVKPEICTDLLSVGKLFTNLFLALTNGQNITNFTSEIFREIFWTIVLVKYTTESNEEKEFISGDFKQYFIFCRKNSCIILAFFSFPSTMMYWPIYIFQEMHYIRPQSMP